MTVEMTTDHRRDLMRITLTIFCVLLALAGEARAVKIADITRLSGQRKNQLVGFGLVFGLNGTGDGGDFAPAIKPLAAMLGNFANSTSIQELSKTTNVALVQLNVTIPSTGV